MADRTQDDTGSPVDRPRLEQLARNRASLRKSHLPSTQRSAVDSGGAGDSGTDDSTYFVWAVYPTELSTDSRRRNGSLVPLDQHVQLPT